MSVARRGLRARPAWLLALYLAGAAHWLWFFTPQGPPSDAEDWPKEFRYYAVLEQAVRQGELPYFVSRAIYTRKFLALPEVLASPQLLLLRFLDTGPFITLNCVLLYSAGFVGLLLLARRHDLGGLAFTWLWLMWGFNGHVTSHLAAGHSMWVGYFLLPYFVLLAQELAESAEAHPALALTLFLILMQGALHIFVWCVFALVLLAAFHGRTLRSVARVLVWTALASAVRLAPAAFLVPRRDQDFRSGYAGLWDVWLGLVSLRDAGEAYRHGLGWWEFDQFVSGIGFLWLVGFVAYRRRREPGRDAWRAFDAPLALLALASLGPLYGWLSALLPPFNIERVSSRFLILPLLFLTLEAAVGLQLLLEAGRSRAWLRPLAWSAALGLAACLLAHSAVWRPSQFARHVRQRTPDLTMRIVPPREAGREHREGAYLATASRLR